MLLLSGCTVINIDGGQAIVRGGTLQLVAPPNTEIIAVQSRGLGLVSGVGKLTLGYQSESAILKLADGVCTIIIFDANLDQQGRDFWRGMAKDRPDICMK